MGITYNSDYMVAVGCLHNLLCIFQVSKLGHSVTVGQNISGADVATHPSDQ